MSAVAQLLKSSDIFAGLGEKTLETLATGMREVKFNAGKQIFSRHDPAACLYVIVEGRARLSIVSAEGRELSFRLLGRGETLGEIALLDGGRRSADATALTDVVAMSLARSVLDSLISTDPDVSRGIICFVCSRLRSRPVCR